MRVIVQNVAEFIGSLEAEEPSKVYNKTVYVSVIRTPLDGTKKTAAKWSVVFQASAVVDLPDGGQYILEVGEDCGTDYTDSTDDPAGTEQADDLRGRVRQYCRANGLTVRPGVVDM
ncbi:MAG: hypothetical protein V3W28_03695 [Thermoplasmata archaeon]